MFVTLLYFRLQEMEDKQSPPVSACSLSVAGRCFLITGGTQGLGLAVARSLKRLGAVGIILVSRSKEKGVAAVEELEGGGDCKAWHVVADLSEADQAASVFSQVEKLIGDDEKYTVTGIVNAAATTSRGNLFTTTPADFDAQFALNVRAPFLITQAAANHMIRRKRNREGSIVNICSVASHGGAPFIMAYSCSKSALVTLTKNNAAELSSRGIRVNAVNMGWCLTDNEDKLQTRQTDSKWSERADASVPLGRILRPEDVAATVCFLLSAASSMTTGSVIDLHPEFANGMLSLLEEDSR